jgi:hypothetical protein
MENINGKDLYEFYLETINCCSSKLLTENDETVCYYLLEILDSNVHSFFHEDVLKKLRNDGFINDQIFDRTLKLKERAIVLLNDNKHIVLIRNSESWLSLFSLGDEIISQISDFVPNYH